MSSREDSRDLRSGRGRGELYILSAPSGAGKSTLIGRLLASPMARDGSLRFSISHTTRSPRQGEVDGRDYHFVTRDAFEELVEQEGFLEWAEVHDNLYGTALSEIEPFQEQGVDVVLDIDVQGAAQVLRSREEAQGILVLPPSYQILEGRLRSRGLDDDETIARRLANSVEEIEQYPLYSHVIINDDVDRAAEALEAVVSSRRHGLVRMQHRVEEILENFRAHVVSR